LKSLGRTTPARGIKTVRRIVDILSVRRPSLAEEKEVIFGKKKREGWRREKGRGRIHAAAKTKTMPHGRTQKSKSPLLGKMQCPSLIAKGKGAPTSTGMGDMKYG